MSEKKPAKKSADEIQVKNLISKHGIQGLMEIVSKVEQDKKK